MRFTAPRLIVTTLAIGSAALASTAALASVNSPHHAAAPKAASAPLAGEDTNTITSTESDAALEAYWTPARLAAAAKRDITVPKPTGSPTAAYSALASTGAEGGAEPSAAVSTSSTAGSGTLAAKKSAAAKIWTKHGTAPARTIGKLFGETYANIGQGWHWYGYSCSATVVTSPHKNMVWTAGHCLSNGGSPKTTLRWSRKVVFAPDYVDGKTPLGLWTLKAKSAKVGPNFFSKGDVAYDLAAFAVNKRKGKLLQNVTGSQGIRWNFKGRSYNLYSFGYPGDLLPSKQQIDPKKLRYCSGKTVAVNYGKGKPYGMAMHCTMGHGASGGPWIYKLSKKGYGYVVGVNSTHRLDNDYMFTPYHGNTAKDIYNYVKKH